MILNKMNIHFKNKAGQLNFSLFIHAAVLLLILTSSSVSFAETEHYQSPDKTHIYLVGSEIDYPPFCLLDENGNPDGFSVDLIKAVCNTMGLNIELKPGLWNDIKQELEEGQIDILPLVGRSPEREKVFDFTFPYHTLHGAVFVRTDTSDITTLDDLKHKNIAVMKGDNAHEYLIRSGLTDNITPTDTFKTAFIMLSQGRCDAVVAQKLLGIELIETLNLSSIHPLDIKLNDFAQDFSFAVKEGNHELLAKLNEGLAIVIADGTYDRIHKKWWQPVAISRMSQLEKLKLAFPYLAGVIFLGILVSLYLTRREVRIKTLKLQETVEQLKISEEYYRTLIEAAMDGIWIVDMNGNILEANKTYADMVGYSREELLSMKISDLDDHETDEMVVENIKNIRQLGQLRFEKTHSHKNGTKIPFELNVQYKDWKDGRVVAFLRDISDRMRAEESLRKSETLYKTLSENSPAVIYQFKKAKDGSLSFTYINDQVTQIIGFKPEDIMTDASLLINSIHPEDLSSYQKAQEESAVNGTPFHLIFRALVKGRSKWIEARSNPTKMDNGNIIWDGLFHDISDRRKAEEQYTTLFNEMMDAFALHKIILDDTGTPSDYQFIKVNPAFEKMTGLKQADIAGKRVLEIMPETESHWIETYGKVALTGEPVFFENYSKELARHFEVKAFQPEPMHFACIFADVTDRKLKEEKQKLLEEQIMQNQKMEAIGTLAGGIAHDFNNMLGIMSGLNEINMIEVDKNSSLYENMVEMQTTIDRAATLPRQLLTFSRKDIVTIKSINLNQLVLDMWKMLTRVGGEDIHMSRQLSPEKLTIQGDESQIQQIFMNLVINAVFELRNMKQDTGKHISVVTEYLEWDDGAFYKENQITPGKYAVIRIKDNGPGISEDIQERIFEPFYTTKKFGSGTGLGLSTVFGIVKEAEGYIFVDSEPGKGAEFIILWPASFIEETPEGIQQARKIKPGKGHILIVEDEDQLLNIASKTLSYAGYHILKARNGEQAEKIINAPGQPLDLLFTDIILPGKDGVQIAEDFLKKFPEGVILFASGYPENRFETHSLPAHSFKLISKPYSPTVLTEEIYSLITHKA